MRMRMLATDGRYSVVALGETASEARNYTATQERDGLAIYRDLVRCGTFHVVFLYDAKGVLLHRHYALGT